MDSNGWWWWIVMDVAIGQYPPSATGTSSFLIWLASCCLGPGWNSHRGWYCFGEALLLCNNKLPIDATSVKVKWDHKDLGIETITAWWWTVNAIRCPMPLLWCGVIDASSGQNSRRLNFMLMKLCEVCYTNNWHGTLNRAIASNCHLWMHYDSEVQLAPTKGAEDLHTLAVNNINVVWQSRMTKHTPVYDD